MADLRSFRNCFLEKIICPGFEQATSESAIRVSPLGIESTANKHYPADDHSICSVAISQDILTYEINASLFTASLRALSGKDQLQTFSLP